MARPRLDLRRLAWLATAWVVATLAGCGGPEVRFDTTPPPLSTASLVSLGLHDDPTAWGCVDAAHDRYLEQWRELARNEARELSDRIREARGPLQLGDREANGMADLYEQFARRHAQLMRRLETLDDGLLSDWSQCLGTEWADRLAALRIDRSIQRARAVAEGGGPSILDLRLMIPGLQFDDATREAIRREMLEYAQRLEPMARRLAQARLQAPLERQRELERQRGVTDRPELKAFDEDLRQRERRIVDGMLQLGLETIDRLQGALPEASRERLRDALVDAADQGRPRFGMELLAPIAVELKPIDDTTRREIRTAIEAHETADRLLRERFAALAARDPADPSLAEIRAQRRQILRALNAKVLSLLPESMQPSMKRVQGESVAELRREMDLILDPAVAARLQAQLPDPEPAAPVHRLPVRNGTNSLLQMLPPDFAAWAAIRLPGLAEGDLDRSEPIRLLVQDAGERWTLEMQTSLQRLEPLTKPITDSLGDPQVSLNETQRRVRAAISEYDAIRASLQRIEDDVFESAAAVAGLQRTDPRMERLRVERATEFAGLAWRDLPVHTLFRLDREATIDLPTVVEEMALSAGARAIADMILVDNAVAVIESSEALRAACVTALRSVVLDLKRATLRGVAERQMGPEVERAVRSAATGVAVVAQTRMELQRSLMQRIAEALTPTEARELRRAYWERAFPELFVERRPCEPVIDRLVESLPPQGDLRAAADALVEARATALDAAIPDLVEARRQWMSDANRIGRGTFTEIERQAPALGMALRIRDEINARMLRSLASLHGDDPAAWEAVAAWARERPFAYEQVNPRPPAPKK
ncbi:MAG: hypothetical protein ACOYMI_09445 [Phycisphaerales bacterium]|jgi:hypothetical protein